MAKPTEEQIRKLEAAHKGQFVDLVLANKLFISLLPKIKGKKPDSKEYKAIMAFGTKIIDLIRRWYIRQKDFEIKAGIPKADPNLFTYFLKPQYQDKVIAQAKAYLDPKKAENQIMGCYGIGIIPLIIWAIIAIAAAYTVTSVVDQTNTTAEEKAELLKQTESTLKDLGVTGSQAASIISSTQEQASDTGGGLFGGGLIKMGGFALVGYFALQAINKSKTAPAKA